MAPANPSPYAGSSPASEAAVGDHQTRELWRELGKARRHLRAAAALDPLGATQRRLRELAKLAVRLGSMLGGMQAVALQDGAAPPLSALVAAAVLVGVDRLVGGLEAIAEGVVKATDGGGAK